MIDTRYDIHFNSYFFLSIIDGNLSLFVSLFRHSVGIDPKGNIGSLYLCYFEGIVYTRIKSN